MATLAVGVCEPCLACEIKNLIALNKRERRDIELVSLSSLLSKPETIKSVRLYGCVGVFLKNLKNEIQGGIAILVENQKTNFRNYTYNPDNPYTLA